MTPLLRTRTRAPLAAALLAAALTAILAPAAAAGAIDVPYLTGRVVDNANILQADTRGRIAERARDHERKAGNQVVVLTVPSVGDASIEEYAAEVFQSWKLGQKERDNGVLVVVAPGDRKMRIEVGYGLEASLTDAECGSIIRNVMTPQFKAGNYDKGIEDGVTAIVDHLEGTGAIPEDAPASTSSQNLFDEPDMPWTQRLLLGAFIFGIIGLFTVIGVLTPGVGWFLYFFLIPFWAMFPIVVIGTNATVGLLITYLVGYPVTKLLLKRTDWYKKAAADLKTKGTANIGGFTLTSGGSSGSSSWSSGSSSSFSGGGGSSGGGGASGSW